MRLTIRAAVRLLSLPDAPYEVLSATMAKGTARLTRHVHRGIPTIRIKYQGRVVVLHDPYPRERKAARRQHRRYLHNNGQGGQGT